jgi:DNA polymerase III subunit beta
VGLFSISEFGRTTGLSVSALRFYDSVGLIAPAEVDESSGYRRYSSNQVEVAVLVRDLRRLEMPISAIRRFLAASLGERHQLLDQHLSTLTRHLRELEVLAGAVRSSFERKDSVSSMMVSAAEFVEAIGQVAPAAGDNPERPLLQSVLIEAREGSLRLVASDSFRLAVRDLVARGGGSASFRSLVAATQLLQVRPELPSDGELDVTLFGQGLRMIGPVAEVELSSTSADDYPKYEQLFSSDPEASSFTADRVPLTELLDALADKERVRLELTASAVHVGGRSVAVSESWNGPAMTVALNRQFFRHAVSSAVGPDVRVEVTTPIKPLFFKGATDGGFACMVMPIKLD